MAADQKATIMTSYLQVMPSMGGFFQEIDRAMSQQGRKLAKVGAQYAKNFSAGFRGLDRTMSAQVGKSFTRAGSGAVTAGGRAGSGWLSAFTAGTRTIGSSIGSVLAPLGNQFVAAGKRGGYSFAFNFTNMAKFMIKRAAVGISLAAVAAVPAQVAGGGLMRSLNIENAEASLKGLGYEMNAIKSISGTALKSVEGTIYSLDQAVKVASTALASGVQQGAPLEAYLKSVGDAATIAQVDLQEMGTIYNKIQANGKVWSQELNMLADRGIPIFQLMAEEMGMSQGAFRKLVEDGKVQSDVFFKVMNDRFGGAALAGADTTAGAFANMRIAMSKLGAVFFDRVLPVMKVLFLATRDVTDALANKFRPIMATLSDKWAPVFTARINEARDALVGLLDGSRQSAFLDRLSASMDKVGATWKEVKAIFEATAPLGNLKKAINDLGISNKMFDGFDYFLDTLVKLAPNIAIIVGFIANGLVRAIPIVAAVITKVSSIVDTVVNKFAGFDISSFVMTGLGRLELGFNTAQNIIVTFADRVRSLFAPVVQQVSGFFEKNGTLIGVYFQTVGNTFAQLAPSLQLLVPILMNVLTIFGELVIRLLPLVPALVGVGVAIATNVLPIVQALTGWMSQNVDLLLVLAGTFLFVKGVMLGFAGTMAVITAAEKIYAGVVGAKNVILGISAAIQQGYTAATYGSVGATYAQVTANKASTAAVWLGVAAGRIQLAVAALVSSALWTKVAALGASTIAYGKNAIAAAASTGALIASRAAMVAGAVATGIATAAQWAWNAALTANPIGIIIVAVVALVGALIWFFTQTELGKNIWAGFVGFLGDSVANIGKWFEDMGKGVALAWTGLVSVVSDIWNGFTGFLNDSITNVANWIGDIGENISNFFVNIGEGFANVFKGVANFFIGIINNQIKAVNFLIGMINKIQVPIPDFARDLFGGAKSIGFNIPLLNTIPQLATGANVMGPTVAWVGEKRPETVTDLGLTNKLITNANRLAHTALETGRSEERGGDIYNIDIQTTGGDPQEMVRVFKRELRKEQRR